MALVKNKTTERGREFWSHVESIADQVRRGGSASYPSDLPYRRDRINSREIDNHGSNSATESLDQDE